MKLQSVLLALFLASSAYSASVTDDAVKALIDNSYKTTKQIKRLQEEMREANLKIKRLQEEIGRLKIENSVVKIDDAASKDNNKSIVDEFSNAAVVVWSAHIRKEPNRNSRVAAYEKMGSILKILGTSKDGEWYKTPKGYIKNTLVAPLDINQTIKVIPIKKTINVRKSPVFNKKNIVVTASDVNVIDVYPVLFLGKWYKLKNGLGYVHKKVVREVK